MKEYYESHITMEGDPKILEYWVRQAGWKFSAIDGDPNLGSGVKCYATKQTRGDMNRDFVRQNLELTANVLSTHAKVLRRKIGVVIFDYRSDMVGACKSGCVECNGDLS